MITAVIYGLVALGVISVVSSLVLLGHLVAHERQRPPTRKAPRRGAKTKPAVEQEDGSQLARTQGQLPMSPQRPS